MLKKVLATILEGVGLSMMTIGLSGLARIGWDTAGKRLHGNNP